MENNEATQLDLWQQGEEPIIPVTLEAMDSLIVKLRAAREDYEAKKKIATEAHNVLEEIEKMVVNALNTNGRTKYDVEGVGLAYIVEKEVYTTPKTNAEKTLLFNYIKEKYGGDTLMSMASINYQSLNSWANKEAEAGVMQIPGLEQPTMMQTLTFRKKN